ncbi:hypothetical protein MTR_5g048313 [Medicago truncatula]|uniref:Uncharacterized protein n=1 Tax=Medicago truncatula TaxID=3880 RepID=A0A072UFL6_MEDTR|nr:hypothetical protein MTR_5g048313 [Medicago truncatula]
MAHHSIQLLMFCFGEECEAERTNTEAREGEDGGNGGGGDGEMIW